MNVIRTQKRTEKPKLLSVPSHASARNRTPPKNENKEPESSIKPKVGLDDEEMLFIARRCLAEELISRPVIPAVLAELSTSQSTPIPTVSTSPPIFPPQQAPLPVPVIQRPILPAAPIHRNRMFQLQRLGAGLFFLKFGWIWVSCGGLVIADSVFCTGDIFKLIFQRITQHVFQVGSRLQAATRDTVKLFTEEDVHYN